jgi:hypothetical protein
MGTNYIQQHFWQKEPLIFFKALDNPTASNIILISCFNYKKIVNFNCLSGKKWIYYSGERFLTEKNSDIIISFIPNSQQLIEYSQDNKYCDLTIKEVNLTNSKYTYNMINKDISIKDLVCKYITNSENTNNDKNINNKMKRFIQLRDHEREHIEYIILKKNICKITTDLIDNYMSLYTTLNKDWNYTYKLLSKIDSNDKLLQFKPRFCCFIVSNPQCWERNKMFDLLRLICCKKVDSLGKWKKNVDIIIPERSNREEYLKLISQYRFMITFENHSLPWYHTEKIYNAVSAGTIPIYWGDPLITEIYNQDCFIHVKTFTDKKKQLSEIIACCERIKELEDEFNNGKCEKYIELFKHNIIKNAELQDKLLRENITTIHNIFYNN